MKLLTIKFERNVIISYSALLLIGWNRNWWIYLCLQLIHL